MLIYWMPTHVAEVEMVDWVRGSAIVTLVVLATGGMGS